MNEAIRLKLSMLPDTPGCYLMKGEGSILYVGKAVNLSSRVHSYFRDQAQSPKVAALMTHVDDFDIMLCGSNLEALILECNLIKLHKPYYNILLKDDKHYPYIRINTAEPFPRLDITRRISDDKARYFGPYISATAIRQTMELLRRVFPMRTCRLPLPLDKPGRPCLNYEIGQCLGPCAHLCTPEAYRAVVDSVIAFLKGRYKPVIDQLKNAMDQAAREMQFERAAMLRDSIRDIEGLMEQQNALQVSGAEQDIIALAQDGLDALAQVLYIRGGRMIGGDSFALPREGNELAVDVLSAFILQFYSDRTPPREVLIQDVHDADTMEEWLRGRRGGAVTLSVPQRGSRRDLIRTAQQNAKDALLKRSARQQITQERTVGAMKELAQALRLPDVPSRLEGFDISNTQGTQSVASMVVFVDGVPSKKDYRRAKADSDSERWPLPELILVDGGPEQLRFAREAMQDEGFDVPIFALAERQEEIWLPGARTPLMLDRHSPALHLIQRVRDESHRFAITHHRKRRGKAAIRSRLEEVPGIGPARRRALLAAFRTIKAIGEASVEELLQVKGMTRPAAEALYSAMHPDQPDAPADAGNFADA
jgi:excinuclease ABC subunit C